MRDTTSGTTLTVTFALAPDRPGRETRGVAGPLPRGADPGPRLPEALLRFGPWGVGGLALGAALAALVGPGAGIALPVTAFAGVDQAQGAPFLGVAEQIALFAATLAGFGLAGGARWRAARRTEREASATLTLSAAGYRLRAAGEESARSWAMLERVAESQSHLLLLDRLGGAVAIPKGRIGLGQAEAIRRFAEAAAARAALARP